MSELQIKTFWASTMIMASFGQIAPFLAMIMKGSIRGRFLKLLILGQDRPDRPLGRLPGGRQGVAVRRMVSAEALVITDSEISVLGA